MASSVPAVGAVVAGGGAAAGGQAGVGPDVAVGQPVVLVQPGFLGLGEQAFVRVGVGGVLDLVLGVRDQDVVAGGLGLGQGHEADAVPEEAGPHRQPLGLVGLLVEVDVGDLADPLAARVDDVVASPTAEVGHGHAGSPSSGWVCAFTGPARGRDPAEA
jgi:hypothetical protein